MQKDILMKCGHIANAVSNGKPICAICVGNPLARMVDFNRPNLENRMARCSTCGYVTKSKTSLPFFEYKPLEEFDEYYCGCRGWD